MFVKTMNMMSRYRRRILNRSNDGIIVLQELTEKEENQIDTSMIKYGRLTYLLDNKYKIDAKHIYLYGDIDLNNEEDLFFLNKFSSIICDEYSPSNFIYSNLDYNTGIVSAEPERNQYIGYTCMNYKKWFEYNYLLIGKPKKVIIYSIPGVIIRKDPYWAKRLS